MSYCFGCRLAKHTTLRVFIILFLKLLHHLILYILTFGGLLLSPPKVILIHYVLFRDDYTWYTWLYLMKKSPISILSKFILVEWLKYNFLLKWNLFDLTLEANVFPQTFGFSFLHTALYLICRVLITWTKWCSWKEMLPYLKHYSITSSFTSCPIIFLGRSFSDLSLPH